MNTREKFCETFKLNNEESADVGSCFIEKFLKQNTMEKLVSYRKELIDENFKSIMEDAELVKCVEEFFKYDLNVAETSRNSFMHRNTFLYRIDKITSLTGLNIKKFEDAVMFKLLMIIYNLTNQGKEVV